MKTSSEDPAIIIFTSGTTGPPKGKQLIAPPNNFLTRVGALHAHRVLLGHLPGVEFPHNLFPKHNDNSLLFYTPADWAWIGGLIDVLLPSLHHGVPVLAYRSKRKFDPNFVYVKRYLAGLIVTHMMHFQLRVDGEAQSKTRVHATHSTQADETTQHPAK